MTETVKIEINGVSVEARPGEMLIDATDRAGIVIPRFCYHKKLSVSANCRMCLVEVAKAPKPMPACATPVNEGMVVQTRSPKALAAQKGTLEFLLINHPLDCPICDQGGECELQDLSMGFGGDVSQYVEAKRVVPNPDLGSLISTDMTRCIHCTRCVRFGAEIAGVREMGATGRGEATRIGTYIARTVDSELSGNVIDLCPVGALTSKPFRFRARAWELRQHAGVAAHDCLGSNIYLHTLRGKLLRVVPRDNEELNEVWLSDRDRFGYEAVHSAERLARPMVKEGGNWKECDWNEALAAAVKGLPKGDALGVLASPNSSVEELFLVQKLARGLGSNHIDHRLFQADFRDQQAWPVAPLMGVAPAALERAGAVLMIASNLRKEQPLLNHRVRKAVAGRGARAMVVNPVDFDFNYPLAGRIVAGPAELVGAVAGVAKAALEAAGQAAPAGLGVIGKATADDAAKAIAADLKGAEGAVVLLGTLAAGHPDYSLLRALAVVIAEATGATLSLLTQGANAAGAWLAGAVPHRGPAGEPVAVAGFDARAMVEQPRGGYLLLNAEPERDCWDGAAAARAMASAFVVAVTPFASEALKGYADVLLPAAAFGESSGSFVNGLGDWQSFTGVAAAPGEARPAWKILRVLGNLFDLEGFDYESSDEIMPRPAVLDAVAASAWQGGEPTLAAAAGLLRIGDLAPYAADPLVRRAPALQATADARAAECARLHPADAERLGLAEGESARVEQGGASAEVVVRIESRVPAGCVWLSAGTRSAAGLGPAVGSVTLSKA